MDNNHVFVVLYDHMGMSGLPEPKNDQSRCWITCGIPMPITRLISSSKTFNVDETAWKVNMPTETR